MPVSSPTILIVDDEPTLRTSERICLQAAGYNVREAVNGSDALVQIAEYPPELMLLDLAMPAMDGMTVLAELHSQWSHYPTRVIVLTANGSAKAAIEAVRLGASDFLEKPFTPTDLLTSVAGVLQKRPQYRGAGEGYIDLLERVRDALCAREFEQAERELMRVRAINESDAAYLNLAGVIQEAHGKLALAERFYSRAVMKDPAYRAASQNVTRLLQLETTGHTSLPVALGGDVSANVTLKLTTSTND